MSMLQIKAILEMPEDSTEEAVLERIEWLVDQFDWLQCLEMAGVDNWNGYDYAVQLKNGDR